uniref:B30.2/SPRY domain-containing protein n=1 Tax=Salmo trutta TaxID=8032 RepID=A0A674F221_SALTR
MWPTPAVSCLKSSSLQQMIQERLKKVQEIKHSVDLSQKDAETEISDSVQVFTDLVRSIERSQAELIEVIEEKQKAAERQAEGLIKELEQEITELQRRSTELEQLSHTEDHLHLLQKMEKLPDVKLKRIQQYAVDVTLDPDTAHPYLIMSEDGKQVRHGGTRLNRPYNPNRFDQVLNILGKEGSSSGRFYYKVNVQVKTMWTLGVARESINRKGNITKKKPQKVGVFVDYEEGQVSFYDVEARSHIYSFTVCTFTEKVYPFLGPGNDKGENSSLLFISPVNHPD